MILVSHQQMRERQEVRLPFSHFMMRHLAIENM